MTLSNAQASVTATEDPPVEAPAELEVEGGGEEKQSGANARIQELVAERKAAVERVREMEEQAARERSEHRRLLQTLTERQHVAPVAPVDDDDDLEPAEREVKRLRTELDDFKKEQARAGRAAAGDMLFRDIRSAVRQYEFGDPEDVRERLAAEALAAEQIGRQFDAEARAEVLWSREDKGKKAARKEADELRLQLKRQTEEQTSSLVTGTPGPPVVEAPVGDVPRIGTPERAAYDRQMTASILAKHRV